MFDMGERRRRALRFTGTVQGVGFRWNSKAIADSLGCTGWVRNEWDGSVQMELQGTDEQVARFFSRLHEQYARWHVDYAIDSSEELEVMPDEGGFVIRA
ncbi:acylphosphatase [Atopobiaceae bacterium SGI.236]|nr:acylphosphatase [Atopobiaceae bacterium]